MKQGLVKESPSHQASYNILKQSGAYTWHLLHQLDAYRFFPLHVVTVTVYLTEQLHGGKLSLTAELRRDGHDLLILEEVNVKRKEIKP